MSLNINSFRPVASDMKISDGGGANAGAAEAARMANTQLRQQGGAADGGASSPAVQAHGGRSGFDGAAKQAPVRLAGDPSAANAILSRQPGAGHNGGPPMQNTPLNGPTVPAHTTDPAKGSFNPRNLSEQAMLNQVRANPAAGEVAMKPGQVGDPRFGDYVKMRQMVDGPGGPKAVHYMFNRDTGHATDLKIKGTPEVSRELSNMRQMPSQDGNKYGVNRDGFHKFDPNGRYMHRISASDVPKDIQRPLTMRALNLWSRLGPRGDQ